MDKTHTGFISNDDLRVVLRDDFDEVQIQELIDDMDSDKDGKISLEEFTETLAKKTAEALEAVGAGGAQGDGGYVDGPPWDLCGTGRREWGGADRGH